MSLEQVGARSRAPASRRPLKAFQIEVVTTTLLAGEVRYRMLEVFELKKGNPISDG